MVLPGQYLERPTLIQRDVGQGRSLTLEGLFHRGIRPPAVLVCSPHPSLGGSMDAPVVAELAWAVSRSEHASLRFNYQGVGASPGKRVNHVLSTQTQGLEPQPLSVLEQEGNDALAASRHLLDSVHHERLVVAGYSFGAAVALWLAQRIPRLAGLALIAPPLSVFDFSSLASQDSPLYLAWGQEDPWVDSDRLHEILGNRARREKILPQADHAFSRGLTELGSDVAGWVFGLV